MHPPARPYTLIDHTADFGVQVFGSDPENLFANAAFALFDLITDLPTLDGGTCIKMRIRGEDRADLMVNWLRELLYLWNGRELLVKSVNIKTLSQNRLSASVFCDPYDPGRHTIIREIKAVTYHQVRVEPGVSGWEAGIIFDV